MAQVMFPFFALALTNHHEALLDLDLDDVFKSIISLCVTLVYQPSCIG